jgi:hypothetical protein
MKRFPIILTAILWAGSAFAQMMPDSTVQVCAYWNVGDKYHYQIEESKYKIDNQTDTSDVELSAEILTLEVVDATDSTYRVRVTSDDFQHSDYNRMAIQEEIMQQFGSMPYEFETDEFGTFKRLIIKDEDLDNFYLALDIMVDRIAEERGLADEGKPALKAMMQALLTRERLMAAYMEEITPLLWFHGLRLSQDAKVDYQTEVPSFFGDESTITMNGQFWVDEELTDEYSAVLHNVTKADPDDMRKYVKAFMGTAANALGTGDDIEEAADEIFKDASIELIDDAYEEIHLDTGWPINYDYVRTIRVKMQGQEQEQVQTRTVTIIIEEEEGESEE